MPTTPIPVRASFTSSSLNGLMTASIFFIAGPPTARGATPVPTRAADKASANRVFDVRLRPTSRREDAYESGNRQPPARVLLGPRSRASFARRDRRGRPRRGPSSSSDFLRRRSPAAAAALPRPLRNPVLPHLRVQRGAAKAEQRGRGLLVPARALERLENRGTLDLLQGSRWHLGRRDRRRCAAVGG